MKSVRFGILIYGVLASLALALPSAAADQCSVKSFTYPANLTKCQTLELLGGRAKTLQTFNMQADFNPPAKQCEYRQGVKGVFQFKEPNKPAVIIPHPLSPPGKNQILLDKTKLQEDGTDDPGPANNLNYGHRMQGRNTEDDTYDMPDRLTGSRYRGKDEPGIRYGLDDIQNKIEDKFTLKFTGTIIDVATGKPVLGTTRSWDVGCSNLTTPPPGDDQEFPVLLQ